MGFFSSLFFVNACLHVGFSTCMAFCAHVWITHRQDEETVFPKEKPEGNERNERTRGEVCTPLPSSSALSSCFVSSSRGLCISLLENKSAFNNQREATAGRNAEGFSGDMLEPTRGASDRQEEGSM